MTSFIGDLPIPPPKGKATPVGEGQPPMGFFVDETVCIGCKACEVACKQWNQLPSDGYDWRGTSYDNTHALSATTWRHVAFVEQIKQGAGRWLMMSDVCKHCEEAPCVDVCPTGSLIYNEFGDVYVQEDICNGCGYCIAACPFGVLTREEESGHVHKCTLCYDRQKSGMIPACAKVCPTASIQFGRLDELLDRARERMADLKSRGSTDVFLYGDEKTEDYSRLHSVFLLRDNPNAYNLPESPKRPVERIGRRYGYSLAAAAGLTALSAIIISRGR